MTLVHFSFYDRLYNTLFIEYWMDEISIALKTNFELFKVKGTLIFFGASKVIEIKSIYREEKTEELNMSDIRDVIFLDLEK